MRLSKKLTLAAGSILFLVVTELLGVDISYERMMSITGIVVTYLAGQSMVDVKKEK